MKNGYLLALITAFISGVAVFLNKFAVEYWKNPAAFTTAKNIGVALILTFIILAVEKRGLSGLAKKDWLRLLLIGFVGGSIPFLLFFKGLSLTSAVNAAFIHKTLFIWTAIIAFSALKEKISPVQITALVILGISVLMMSGGGGIKFGYGNLLIFAATLIWALETILVQKFFKGISSLTAAWGRMFFGSIFLIAYAAFQGGLGAVLPSNGNQMFWLLLSTAMLLGYVTSFYSAIKYASAAVATSVLVIAAPITIIINSIFVTGNLPLKSLPTIVTAFAGVGVLFAYKLFSRKTAVKIA